MTRTLPIAQRLLLVVAAALVAGALAWSGSLWRMDNQFYDLVTHNRPLPPSPQLTIVAIDHRSLQALGRWPWPRQAHARLLDRLGQAGVLAVALDLVFAEPDLANPDGDRQLAEAIARNGHVLLPVTPALDGREMPQELLPPPAIASAAAGFGHTDLERDADGLNRGVYLLGGLGQPHWPALGAALAGIGREPGDAQARGLPFSPYRWHRDAYAGIRFAGPPGSFRTVSYVDVLEGRIAPALLRDQRVIVGVTANGLGERFLTPMSPDEWMSGAELQANIASMLLQDQAITPLPRAWQVFLSIVLTLVAAWAATLPAAHKRWWGVATLLALAGLAGVALALLVCWERYFAPAASAFATLAVAAVALGLHILHWRTLAERDPLTRLVNRRGFEAAFQHELAASRRSGRPLGLLLVDIDHFKRLNDELGHPVGDEALSRVAAILQAQAPPPRGLAARLGGDEFALLLPDTDETAARTQAAQVLNRIRQLRVGPYARGLTATLGLHCAVAGEQGTDEFFATADAALYRAKRAGRNGYASAAT